MTVEIMTQVVAREVRPSGLEVLSEVPFEEDRWWDNPWLHIVWSYASWITMILAAYGFTGARRWFNTWGRR